MQNTDCYIAEKKVEMRPFQDQSTTSTVIPHSYTGNGGKTCRSDVHFSEDVPNQFYCAICNHVLKCPIQTPCGHRFGKECLESLKRTKEPIVCPVDNETIDLSSVFLDRFCEQEILNLQCNCKFNKNGCQWKGLLRDLENHIKDCEYLVESCTNPGCTELVTKQNIEDHLKNQCNYRMTSCEDCKERFPLAESENHILRCPKAIISCTNECGSQVPRDQLDDHLTKECPLSEQQCSFASNGCEFKGARKELQEHGKEAMKEHLSILNTTAQKTLYQTNKQEDEIRNLKSVFSDLGIKMENQNEALANAKQDLRTQQIKLGIMEKTVSEQKKELVTIRQKLDNCNGDNSIQSTQVTAQVEECMNFLRAVENRIGNMERHIDELKAGHLQQQGGARSLSLTANNMSIERRLERNEHGMAVQDVQLSEHDLKINMLETTSYDGQFIWKIDDWTRRYHEAVSGKSVSLYSAPFYLGRHGYKVCARLYPNGDGMGKGSHVSLFFVVMKGEYDALLRWPFKQKVAFQLYDQDHQLDVVDAFRPDPNSSSFKRPTSNMNIASGCPLFISHADLYQRAYIRDDTMFIKITVDKTGIPPL